MSTDVAKGRRKNISLSKVDRQSMSELALNKCYSSKILAGNCRSYKPTIIYKNL
ncbi:hypothetical protein [Okeania sp. KiyG1]|uniref:hypothetical protein n=1 Tax=Okeania sp. KiyG1 TaxID=2720165 RepID=UPI001921E514|nr:hypothetical protein [Okeania sp. KiyG1]